jgi:hypothetical protein
MEKNTQRVICIFNIINRMGTPSKYKTTELKPVTLVRKEL